MRARTLEAYQNVHTTARIVPTPVIHPEAFFMEYVVRTLAMAEDPIAPAPAVLIRDRDRKWSGDVRRRLGEAGIRVGLTPSARRMQTPTPSALCGRIKEECLDRLIPLEERHFRQ